MLIIGESKNDLLKMTYKDILYIEDGKSGSRLARARVGHLQDFAGPTAVLSIPIFHRYTNLYIRSPVICTNFPGCANLYAGKLYSYVYDSDSQ